MSNDIEYLKDEIRKLKKDFRELDERINEENKKIHELNEDFLATHSQTERLGIGSEKDVHIQRKREQEEEKLRIERKLRQLEEELDNEQRKNLDKDRNDDAYVPFNITQNGKSMRVFLPARMVCAELPNGEFVFLEPDEAKERGVHDKAVPIADLKLHDERNTQTKNEDKKPLDLENSPFD